MHVFQKLAALGVTVAVKLDVFGQKALLTQVIRADQPCVTGKAGRGEVRGAVRIDWPHRQHLPDSEARSRQKVHETTCFGAQISVTGQRGRVQQNPGLTLLKPGL